MATLVFDIETSAQPLDNFDEAQQEYLFRETEKLDDAIAKQAKREEITRFMSLWPFTSQVVCIAMLNAETGRGQSIFIAEDWQNGLSWSSRRRRRRRCGCWLWQRRKRPVWPAKDRCAGPDGCLG